MVSAVILVLLQLTGAKMDNRAESPGPTGLKGEQFWNQPLWQKPAMDFAEGLLAKDVLGTFIDAPALVHLSERPTVPMIAIRSVENKRSESHPFHSAQVVLSHLESGLVDVSFLGEAPPPGLEEPTLGPGSHVEDHELDLGMRMEASGKLGRYRVLLLQGDESSNPLDVSVYPARGWVDGAEGKKTLERMRSEGGPPARLLAGKSAGLRSESPTAPGEGPLWRPALKEDAEGDLSLHLEFRVTALPRFLVPKDRPLADEQGRPLHAVLPVSLIGFDGTPGLCFKGFVGLPVHLPPAGASGRPVLSGRIAFSLTQVMGGRQPRRSLTLWAVSLDQAAKAEITLAPNRKDP